MWRRLSVCVGLLAWLEVASGCAQPNTTVGAATGDQGTTGSGGSGGGASSSTSTGTGGHDGTCVTKVDCGYLDDPCNDGNCLNGMCEKLAAAAKEAAPCDDGLFCTESDTCQGGVCKGGPKACSGPDVCHVGTCDEATKSCKSAVGNEGGPCESGDPCTSSGQCAAGKCVKGSAIDCSVFDSPCSVGVCDAKQGCIPQPLNDGTVCNDGMNSPCTVGACMAGTCTSHPAPDGASCNDGSGNPCSAGTCMAGACAPHPVSDGSTCDDGMFNPCTAGTCTSGTCISNPVSDGSTCDDGMFNPCTSGTCTSGTCISNPVGDGSSCEDGLFCTIDDHCVSGNCVAGPKNPCAPQTGCWTASCDEFAATCSANPTNEGGACDDGNSCTQGEICMSGACINGQAVNEGAMCDDGSGCTSATSCTAGVCGGGVGPVVYFSDDFHDNSKGWTLGSEWQIGPAMTSSGQDDGNSDPALDHSPSADNGVAGIVIGGNETPVKHDYFWLTSPPFDTSGASGSVILGYQRWLNSDFPPYMDDSVQVYDGTKWVNLWTNNSSVSDASWMFFQFDVTAFKNAAMQVRFGYDIQDASLVFVESQWNLDDVLVADAACP